MTSGRGFCSILGCGKPAWSRGWCRMHYYRWHQHGDPLVVEFVRAKDGEPSAFIEALPLTGEGCVIWPYARNNEGYGQLNIGKGKKVLAHRRSCERRHGPPPSPLHQAAHSCGKGHEGCVAPWHLDWKLPVDNAADLDRHGTRLRGERAPWAKLTARQVDQIRALAGTVSQRAIGEQFGISQSMVGMILRGQRWAQ